MKIDLDKMSREELQALRDDVDRAMKTLDTRRKAEAKKAAEHAAKEYGFSLDELLAAGGGKGGKSSKGMPKYANPDNRTQTWTGRGRKPNWVIDALSAGKSMDDLAI